MPSGPLSPQVASVIRTLAVDRVTAEVIQALRAAGVRAILLKGPSITQWLYQEGHNRVYGDTDLLVAPQEQPAAHVVLEGLGFRPPWGGPRGWDEHAVPWVRRVDDATVDLHRRLPGTRLDDTEAWGILSQSTEMHDIGGVRAETLDEPGRALLLGLHAASHARFASKPLQDLERGLGLIGWATWVKAAALAKALGAEERFAAGLRLAQGGSEIAERLGLPSTLDPEYLLRRQDAVPRGVVFVRIAEMRGLRTRLLAITSWAFPPRAYMHVGWPSARRGLGGLALAYVLRLAKGPGAALAWRRAIKAARR